MITDLKRLPDTNQGHVDLVKDGGGEVVIMLCHV